MAVRSACLRVAAATVPLLLPACFDEPPLPGSGVVVFDDAFPQGVTPYAFAGSLLTSLSVDGTKSYAGARSIRLEIPAASTGFSGGAVLAENPRDLTGTSALVFWATASRDATFDKVGFGLNFDPYPSPYIVALNGLPLTTEWTRHLIPIPDPAKIGADRGMLWYAEADPTAYTAWLDEVKFDRIDPAVMNLQASIATTTATIAPGGTAQVGGLTLRYTDFDGTEREVDSTDVPGSGPAAAYFTFASSNPAAARVDAAGEITGVGLGQAFVTATLGGVPVAGTVTVNVVDVVPTEPDAAPPAPPSRPPADVISLLSMVYTDVPVDTWRTIWSSAVLTEVTIGGDDMKKYSSLDFVGVEFLGANLIDATAMDYFHVDVWTPDATTFRVKLVDAGADGAIGTGGDDSEHELVFGAGSTPALSTGSWVSLDLPLASFTNLASRAHLAQLIFSALPSGGATVFVDNVYFHR